MNVLLTQPLDTAVSVAQTRRSLRASGTKLQAPGAYAALPVSLLLTLNPGIQYYVFEALKARLLRRGRRRALTVAEAFAAGAAAKAAATVATYPAIRAKTLCQSAAGGRFRGLGLEFVARLDERTDPVNLAAVGDRTADTLDDFIAALIGHGHRDHRRTPGRQLIDNRGIQIGISAHRQCARDGRRGHDQLMRRQPACRGLVA